MKYLVKIMNQYRSKFSFGQACQNEIGIMR